MSTKKTDSVAYIFEEMDPSEKVEFERLLRMDENLLIEVESLRAVNNKISELPVYSAPDELLESVCIQAAEKAESTRKNRKKPFYYAAAALLSIGFTAGALLMETSETSSQNGAASMGSVGSTGSIPQTEQSVGEHNSDLTPWVDRNEILHFTGNTSNPNANRTDSLLQNSYQRLTPVSDPSQSRVYRRNLHLTGSRN